MITTLAKILAVTLSAGSVAFLGVTLSMVVGTYPWSQHEEGLGDYVITSETTEAGTSYTIAKRQTGSTATTPVTGGKATSKIPAEVYLAGYRDAQQRFQQRFNDADARITQLTGYKELLLRQRRDNEAALAVYEKLLSEEEQRVSDAVDALAQQALAVTDEIGSVRQDQIDRREEVERLRAEYEQIRADHTRAIEQKEKLKDLINRLEGTRSLLQRRRAVLQQQLGSTDGDSAVE